MSRTRLQGRRTLPRATCDWALDSGGFTEVTRFGGWTIDADEYVRQVRLYRDEIGRMQWAAPMDWMCEDAALKATGLTIREHQRRTLESYLRIRDIAPELPIIPVLQGSAVSDYLRHVEDYSRAGIDLQSLPLVGLGSVCRRQSTNPVVEIVSALQPLKLHGFGVKSAGIARMADMLASSDSLAWSFTARYDAPLTGCTHKNCANCIRYALRWRDRVLASSLFVE